MINFRSPPSSVRHCSRDDGTTRSRLVVSCRPVPAPDLRETSAFHIDCSKRKAGTANPRCGLQHPAGVEESARRIPNRTVGTTRRTALRGLPEGMDLQAGLLTATTNRACKRHAVACDNEMIQNPDVDQREGLLQRLRQQLVSTARFGDAGRMVVREDHRRSVVRKASLQRPPRG